MSKHREKARYKIRQNKDTINQSLVSSGYTGSSGLYSQGKSETDSERAVDVPESPLERLKRENPSYYEYLGMWGMARQYEQAMKEVE